MERHQAKEIGNRIRDLREASPHTNRSIADAVGVIERSVANWVSGTTGITYDHATAVAELFDVDLNWLWTGQKGSAPGLNERLAGLEECVEEIHSDIAKLLAASAEQDASQAQRHGQRTSRPAKEARKGRGV